ncbi:P-loop containing nucleoside triphosphate hydrolase protein [Thelephora ganbajun]|uniref:P-loop containing nucleoside triphosphate hydrolase protein n=1 Tax=Thelephora ganbajun TaxID=370292 RepID=A0ACB6ZW07_THEGA|nr:P-loop containing nucleoside triphosphate hydrolase protein [Thelephora ganbajun]
MVQACSSLLATGACQTANCTKNHLVKFCQTCRLICQDVHSYASHLGGRGHAAKLKYSSINVFCPICDKNFVASSWNSHIQGRKHLNASQGAGQAPRIQPQEGRPPPGSLHCRLCNSNVKINGWETHQSGPAHRKKEQYFLLKAVFDVATNDKGSAVILPPEELDFETVEPAHARQGVTKQLVIQVTDPSASYKIVQVTVAGSSSKRNTAFTVERPARNQIVDYGIDTTLNVTCAQSNRGRFEARVEVLFEDIRSKERFVIVRPVLVAIGSVEEHRALQPVTPYVAPRRPKQQRHMTEVEEGVVPPFETSIPWTTRLPFYMIPDDLFAFLSKRQPNLVPETGRKFLPQRLAPETYTRLFEVLLWCEEFKISQDLEKFDIPNARIEYRRPYHFLPVPGLAEKRPSVLIGDEILVQPTGAAQGGKWYSGFVHIIERDEVGLRFGRGFQNFNPGERFYVRFKYNRIVSRREHQAIKATPPVHRLQFPLLTHVKLQTALQGAIVIYNPDIETNPAQKRAVSSIVRLPPGSPPFIVFGPPGTGKTVTIIEAIRQLLRNPDVAILASAPSNAAADIVAVRLKDYLTPDQLFRFYAPSYRGNVPPGLAPYTFKKGNVHSVHELNKMASFRVIVTTCLSGCVPPGIGLPRGHFTHIFVDEAGQASEPECLVPITGILGNATNVILSGDPCQLGPIVQSPIAVEFGLGVSFLERLMEDTMYDEHEQDGNTIVKLVKNFRSHVSILQYPNNCFYKNDLEACGNQDTDAFIGSTLLPNPSYPVIFHAIPGLDQREANSPSFFNVDEVLQVKTYVEELHRLGAGEDYTPMPSTFHPNNSTVADDVGIITPYHGQVLKIRQALANSAMTRVKVASVEEYQGQERKIIIISTVRSSRNYIETDLRHTLGFVSHPRRFNVAVTRAKALLIVVGDPATLSLDPLWKGFLALIHRNGGWTGDEIPWNIENDIEDDQLEEATRIGILDNMQQLAERVEALTLDAVFVEPDDGDDDS